jgi:hypothetical protein
VEVRIRDAAGNLTRPCHGKTRLVSIASNLARYGHKHPRIRRDWMRRAKESRRFSVQLKSSPAISSTSLTMRCRMLGSFIRMNA